MNSNNSTMTPKGMNLAATRDFLNSLLDPKQSAELLEHIKELAAQSTNAILAEGRAALAAKQVELDAAMGEAQAMLDQAKTYQLTANEAKAAYEKQLADLKARIAAAAD